MSSLIVFVLLMCSGGVQWLFLLRVKQLVEERHPQIRATLTDRRDRVSFDRALRFAWRTLGRALEDRELARNVVLLRWASGVTLMLWLAYAVLLVRGF